MLASATERHGQARPDSDHLSPKGARHVQHPKRSARATRAKVIELLDARLADAIDLQTQLKQAHWNVKGPTFIGLHELFDKINEAVEDYVDDLAERVVQLGGWPMARPARSPSAPRFRSSRR